MDDRLIGRVGRQVHLNLRLHLHDARADLRQAQPQRVIGRAAAGHDQPWRVGAPEKPGVGVSTQILRPLNGGRYTRQLS